MDLANYLSNYSSLINGPGALGGINAIAELFKDKINMGGKILLFGNGASASLAAHAATDFTKQAGIRAVTFHDPSLITAFSNDFGYENWMARASEFYGDEHDAMVLISVSGESSSIIKAAEFAKKKGLPIVGFSGREQDNKLQGLSDISMYVPSHAFNVVENVHSIWLTAVVDLIVGTDVYEVSHVGDIGE